jgi:hypothetical protein
MPPKLPEKNIGQDYIIHTIGFFDANDLKLPLMANLVNLFNPVR